MKNIPILILLAILAAACSPAIPAGEYHSVLIPTYDPNAPTPTPHASIPTPVPQVTEVLDAPWLLPHTEDFSDPDSGWEIGTWDTGTVYITDGKYEVTSLGNSYFMWGEPYMTFGDISIEVDAAQAKGAAADSGYGFFCRRNLQGDSGMGYALLVSGDGYYSIQKTTGGNYDFLLDWAESDAIKKAPEVNHLKAECVGDTIRLFANGTLLAEVTDPDFASGDIGLVAISFSSEPVTVEFDNLVVSAP